MVPQFKIHLKFVMEQIAKVVYQLIDFEEGESYKIYVKVIPNIYVIMYVML